MNTSILFAVCIVFVLKLNLSENILSDGTRVLHAEAQYYWLKSLWPFLPTDTTFSTINFKFTHQRYDKIL